MARSFRLLLFCIALSSAGRCQSGQNLSFDTLVVVAQSGYTRPGESYSYRLEMGRSVNYSHTEGGVRCMAQAPQKLPDNFARKLKICAGPEGALHTTIHDRPQRYLEFLTGKSRRKIFFESSGPAEYLCGGLTDLASVVRQALETLDEKCSTRGAHQAFDL
ncbi:MAG: hypothetical protein HS115_08165 [Spirochaetales bacterium]|nr:hypothetical protein [Spirochaetales bacterium]